jgi:hypothetical protein
MKTFLISTFLLLSTSVLAVEQKVTFLKPTDGETVTSPFDVEFGVKDMKVEKSGPTKKSSGHHHLIVDGQPVPKGQVIGKNATMLHYGDAQTKTTLTLPPGKHTLTMQFGDGAHKSYGEDYSTTVTVNVEEPVKSKTGKK